jgi:hypothetical protein
MHTRRAAITAVGSGRPDPGRGGAELGAIADVTGYPGGSESARTRDSGRSPPSRAPSGTSRDVAAIRCFETDSVKFARRPDEWPLTIHEPQNRCDGRHRTTSADVTASTTAWTCPRQPLSETRAVMASNMQPEDGPE